MNRLFLAAVAAAAASGIAAAPAVAGLSHNPSFSHKLPVRVPSGAQTVPVRDEHRSSLHPEFSPSAAAATREVEPELGDDKGGASAPPMMATLAPQPVEPGDDRGRHGGASSGGHGGGHDDR